MHQLMNANWMEKLNHENPLFYETCLQQFNPREAAYIMPFQGQNHHSFHFSTDLNGKDHEKERGSWQEC